jgi:hypothetical protein
MKKIYEVIDASDDEMYWPMALYLNKEEAIQKCENLLPDDWDSPGYIDDYAKLEIRERPIGWMTSIGDIVFTVEWEKKYNEETDEFNEWVKK